MEQDTIVGICSSVLTATSLIPQLVKLIKEKQPQGMSVLMLIVLLIGHGLWVYYGVLKSDWIIIISNAFALIIDLITSAYMINFKGNKTNEAIKI
jgi:MtN3 and saliva related transmembrane protein